MLKLYYLYLKNKLLKKTLFIFRKKYLKIEITEIKTKLL